MARHGISAHVSTNVTRSDESATIHVASQTGAARSAVVFGVVALAILGAIFGRMGMDPSVLIFLGVFAGVVIVAAVFAIRRMRSDTNGALRVDPEHRAVERVDGLTMLEGDRFELPDDATFVLDRFRHKRRRRHDHHGTGYDYTDYYRLYVLPVTIDRDSGAGAIVSELGIPTDREPVKYFPPLPEEATLLIQDRYSSTTRAIGEALAAELGAPMLDAASEVPSLS